MGQDEANGPALKIKVLCLAKKPLQNLQNLLD